MTDYDAIIIVITDIDPTVRGIPSPHKLIISKLKFVNFYNCVGMILMGWSMEQLNLVMHGRWLHEVYKLSALNNGVSEIGYSP